MKTMLDAKSKKARQVVQAARDLFMRHGMRRISVEEICRKAGVSKVTFYKYFENKSDVLKAVMGEIVREGLARYRAIMDSPAPFREKVLAIIEMKLAQSEEAGMEFIRDLASHPDPEIASHVFGLKERSLHEFMDDLKTLQASGEIRPDLKPEFVSYLYDLILESIKNDRLLNLYPSSKDLTAEWINFLFYGIVGPRSRSGEGP